METLQTTAAEWLVRVQNDELSVGEIADWQRWLAANAEHRKAFERMQEMWQGFERLPNKNPPVLRSKYFRPVLAAAASLALLAVGIAAWWPSKEMTLFETRAAEHREVTLPDGTQLTLGAKSLVWIRFVDSEREVGLDRGEAFFDVAQDKRRPFIVRAGETTITAIGTAFNVRKTGERVLVAVTEGAVKVRETRVAAGQEMTVEPSTRSATVRAAKLEAATAWRSGRLEYLGEPLKYVVADVNRYSPRQIVIGNDGVGELKLTGTVFENDIDAWLRSVEDLLPVKVEHVAPDRIVLSSR